MSGAAFAYFGYIIFFVLLLYVLTLAIFLCIRRNNIKNAIEYRNTVRGTNDAEQDFYDRANYSFEFRTDFDMVAQSALGKGCKFFLCVSRVVGFVFFLAASILLNFVRDNHGLFYFTNWNSLLVTVYYLAASISSLLSVYAKVERNRAGFNSSVKIKWSYTVRCLGLLVHMLFEIAGASSMFVLIFDFYYQRENNADMVSLLNFVRALTVCALIFEMFLNHMNVRFDQYPATIAWTMAYLLFVWPAVFIGIMKQWPYFLLKTDSEVCFGYYMLIFILNFGCYLLWWAIYKIKKTIYIHYAIGRVGGNYWDDDQSGYHDDMHLESTMNPMSMHGLLNPDEGIEMGQRIYDDDGYSVATSAYAIDGYGEGDYEGMEGVEYIDEGAFHDPDVFYPQVMYGPDGMMMEMDPNNVQYGYDPNGIQYDPNGMQYDPNMQFHPNMQYGFDPNMQFDPNMPHGYDPNMHYDPNMQFDPNMQMQYDPRFDPRNHPQYMEGPGHPYQQHGQFQHDGAWDPASHSLPHEGSWDFDGGSRSTANIAPFGGRDTRSQNFSSTYAQFGDDGMEQGQMGDSARQDQRVMPQRPYAGSVLERGRGGRGAGRGASAGRGGGGRGGESTGPAPSPVEHSGPIHVDAQAFDESGADGEEGDSAAFDYSVVDAWASFTGAGKVPRNAAEAGVQPKSSGGILSYLGFGGAAAPGSPKKGAKRGPPPANSSQKASWFDGVVEGEHGEEYDEEYNFGAEGPSVEEGGEEEGVEFSRSGKHKSGAYIATVSKKEAFRAPSQLGNRRSGSGSNASTPRAATGSSPRAAAGLTRPPSLHKMFRTGSRGANKEGQALNLQALGGREGDSGKGEKSSGMPRPPSFGTMWRPGSFTGSVGMSGSVSASRSPLNLQTLESRTGPHLGRTTSANRMDPSPASAAGETFDYSEMDAWASFNATGRMPHAPDEINTTNERPSGFKNLEPMLAQKSGEKAGTAPKGGWFDTEREGFENMREEAAHFHPEDQPHDSHLAGAYVAQAAKTEAFRAPASLDSHKHKRPVVSPKVTEKVQNPPTNASKGMFRPPSVTRMFRTKSKEAISLQSLGSRGTASSSTLPRTSSGAQLHRPPSAHRLNANPAAENFDYSDMDAWASFNATGRVPHSAEEAGVSPHTPSGFHDLEPMLAQKSGEKAGVSPKNAWFGAQGESADDSFDVGDGADQPHDSHLAGAYVAHAAKGEAFKAPVTLDKTTHRKAPPTAGTNPSRDSTSGSNPMFNMFRTSSRGANNEASTRTLNLNTLGSRGDVRVANPTERSGEKSGAISGEKSGEKGGMFRPPSVPQMRVNRSMAPLKSLGNAAPVDARASAVKSGASAESVSGHNRSFFEQQDEADEV